MTWATSTTWGNVQVGRLLLRETYAVASQFNMNTGAASLTLSGQESYPPLTRAEWAARREDVIGLLGNVLPVTFTNAAEHDGYYRVTDVGADVVDWTRAGQPAGTSQAGYFAWNLRLEGIGPANAVDLESRLAAPGRANDFAQAGERWHAPAGGHLAYTTPDGLPSGSVTRTGEDGALVVYRGVPDTASARWACALADYPKGRVRFSVGGYERSGVGVRVSSAATGWELSNGLVRVVPGAGTFALGVHDGAGWSASKAWNINRGGSASANAIGVDGVTVIRNDFEAITLRMVDSRGPGRNLLDVTLRRGSRFIECYLQTDASSTLAAVLSSAEAGTAGTGYVTATGSDPDGDRYIVGSARTHTGLTTAGGIQLAAATALDFYLGAVVAGGSAVAGDQAAHLHDQYIGAGAETVTGVRR
jgi:hypothetical protein